MRSSPGLWRSKSASRCADGQQRDKLRLVEQRQRVVCRARGLARAVPGHQHAPPERGEFAGIRDDAVPGAPPRRRDPPARTRSAAGTRPKPAGRSPDRRRARAASRSSLSPAPKSCQSPPEIPSSCNVSRNRCSTHIGQFEPAGIIAALGRWHGGSRDAGDQTAFGDGGGVVGSVKPEPVIPGGSRRRRSARAGCTRPRDAHAARSPARTASRSRASPASVGSRQTRISFNGIAPLPLAGASKLQREKFGDCSRCRRMSGLCPKRYCYGPSRRGLIRRQRRRKKHNPRLGAAESDRSEQSSRNPLRLSLSLLLNF